MEDKFLEVGEVFKLEKGMKVKTEIKSKFVYVNGTDEKTQEVVNIGYPLKSHDGEEKKTDNLIGNYVVVKTSYDGGNDSGADYYPDGHHIFAKKLKKDNSYDSKGISVEFYQSGAFRHLIENITKITDIEYEQTFIPKVPKKNKMK